MRGADERTYKGESESEFYGLLEPEENEEELEEEEESE